MFTDKIQKYEWIGIEETQQKPRRLHAGKLDLDFISGRIINVSINEKNVIDEVYFALRDYNWRRIPYRIENLIIKEHTDAFTVTFTAVHDHDGIQFSWEGSITGSDSEISYTFNGVANSNFMKNRIGFCVLHPASCNGVECEVEHFKHETERGAFPAEIAPRQPFFDIKSITHFPSKGVAVKVGFEGDVFEMEDQRNWIDASFKTYCTPLEQPFPAPVKNGDRFHQKVTISLKTESEKVDIGASAGEHTISTTGGDARKGSSFSLGSCITKPLTELQMQRARALELSHLRYDYHFNNINENTEKIFEQVHALGIKLQLAVFFTSDWKHELEALCGLAHGNKDIMWLSVFQQDVKVVPVELLEAVRSAFAGRSISVGSGTDAFYTEINRDRLPESSMDFVSYSNNPQVHAFDNASIMSTVEGQAANLLSCSRLYPHLPIWVSPVSLKMRWNPDATRKTVVKNGEMPHDVEPRQMSLFAASWFLRSAATCINGGAAGVNYFELTGCKGIMEEASPDRDYRFPSLPDMLFPLYYAFFALRGVKDFDVTATVTADATTLVLKNDKKTRVILANPKSETVTLRVTDMPVSVRGFVLDEESIPELAQRNVFSTDDDCWETFNLNGEILLKRYSIFIAEF